jgi:hypothetical protein
VFHKVRKESCHVPEDFGERWQERGEAGGDGLLLLDVDDQECKKAAPCEALHGNLSLLEALR